LVTAFETRRTAIEATGRFWRAVILMLPGLMDTAMRHLLSLHTIEHARGTLSNWLSQGEIDAGNKPGKTTVDNAELREADKRILLLEQENEVLRRAAAYLSQANLPGKGSTRS
jgi:hypothetical protein